MCYVQISESRTNMSIFSAEEDFSRNTLDAVSGVWQKLRYVSELRQPDGHYEHWGLMRKYGKNAAERAILRAHQELALHILRMPLGKLVEQTADAAAQGEISPSVFVARLIAEGHRLLPGDLCGGSLRHFTSVLESLSSLAQAYRDANRQAS